ncbi:hypothetical protein ACWCQL_06430 [Streptomyces sp. NPDC002073]
MKKIPLLTVAAVAALGLAAPYAQAVPGAEAPAPASVPAPAPAAAGAAPRELRLTAAAEIAVPVHGGVKTPPSKTFTVNIRANVEGNNTPVKRTVTLDFGSLKGKADWGMSSRSCRRTGDTAVCEDSDAIPTSRAVSSVWVRAAKGAKSGVTGRVEVTATAAGATVKPWTVKVDVGGHDLRITRGDVPQSIPAGSSLPLPVSFSNKGTEPAKGLLVWLRTTRGLGFAKRYGNCAYGVFAEIKRNAALCTIPGTVAAGSTWRLTESPTVKAGPRADSEWIDYGVFADTKETLAALRKGGTWAQGTGPALTVTKVRTAPLAVDLEETDNWAAAWLTVQDPAEFAAVGAAVRGRAGRTVGASFGFDFKGPGASATDDRARLVTRVTLPDGVRATTLPAQCRASTRQGRIHYLCVQSARTYTAGDKPRFAFKLRIDRMVAGAKGEVWLYREYAAGHPNAPGPGPQRPAGDTDPKDDRAAITVAAP